ncbi:MAG TPA: hypothetical protein PK103_09655 [Elusimicrobiales bacterium]|nr:hypothetical protein [Elusimicrobiales bacterium]HOL63611.1 hypothetical protein [Elusimicrobiales bacterium]
MAKNEDIFSGVYNILNSAKSNTLSYVNNILKGVRDFDIEIENSLPAIILEPIRDTEIEATLPNRKRVNFIINIFCIMKTYDYENQITGGAGTKNAKGILDMVSDVKNVLNANRNLNGNVLKFRFTDTDYSFEDFPIRQAVITMENDYILEDTGR